MSRQLTEEALGETSPADTRILHAQPPEPCLLFRTLSLRYFVMAAKQTNAVNNWSLTFNQV